LIICLLFDYLSADDMSPGECSSLLIGSPVVSIPVISPRWTLARWIISRLIPNHCSWRYNTAIMTGLQWHLPYVHVV